MLLSGALGYASMSCGSPPPVAPIEAAPTQLGSLTFFVELKPKGETTTVWEDAFYESFLSAVHEAGLRVVVDRSKRHDATIRLDHDLLTGSGLASGMSLNHDFRATVLANDNTIIDSFSDKFGEDSTGTFNFQQAAGDSASHVLVNQITRSTPVLAFAQAPDKHTAPTRRRPAPPPQEVAAAPNTAPAATAGRNTVPTVASPVSTTSGHATPTAVDAPSALINTVIS